MQLCSAPTVPPVLPSPPHTHIHSPLLARLSLALCAEWLTADAAPDTAPATGSTALCLMLPRAWEVLQGGNGVGGGGVQKQADGVSIALMPETLYRIHVTQQANKATRAHSVRHQATHCICCWGLLRCKHHNSSTAMQAVHMCITTDGMTCAMRHHDRTCAFQAAACTHACAAPSTASSAPSTACFTPPLIAPAADLAPCFTSSAAEAALPFRSEAALPALPLSSPALPLRSDVVDDERPLRSEAPALAALAVSDAACEAWYLALSRWASACVCGGGVWRGGEGRHQERVQCKSQWGSIEWWLDEAPLLETIGCKLGWHARAWSLCCGV
jgi:hypothetical protein